MAIYFYGRAEPYYEFSNFAPFGLEMDGAWWRTVEHYFQAQKFEDAEYREKIRRSNRARDAKMLGSSRSVELRSDWDAVKDGVMYDAVSKKFATHGELRDLLLSTGDEVIVENAPSDYYWGCGQDGTGRNMLGKILMRVRDEMAQTAG